jgi:hypothetical protein
MVALGLRSCEGKSGQVAHAGSRYWRHGDAGCPDCESRKFVPNPIHKDVSFDFDLSKNGIYGDAAKQATA